MAVDYIVVGAVTHDSVTVSAKFDASSSDVRLAVSENADMSSAVYSSSPTATSTVAGEERAKFTVAGLSERTRYFCQVQISDVGNGDIGGFWTTWEAGTVGSYPIAHASCTYSVSNQDVPVNDVVAVHQAAETGFWAMLGDLHYENDGVTATDAGRAALLDNELDATNKGRLFYEQPCVVMHDDHDAYGNDTAGTDFPTIVGPQHNAWDAVWPHYPYGHNDTTDTIGLYHAFQVGRFRVIVTDLRTFRDTNGDTDTAGPPMKTMLGATQRQWFKDQLDVARDNGSVAVVWCNTQVWNAEENEGTTNNDAWWEFDYERQDLDDHMNDLSGGARPKVIDLTGDMHAVAYKRNVAFRGTVDNGQRMDSFSAASLYAGIGILRGTDWEDGPDTGDQQFGRLCLRDGPEGLRVDWSLFDESFQTAASAMKWPLDYAALEPADLPSENTVTFANGDMLGIRKALA